MRTYKEAEQAGKHVGFELVGSIDIAVASPVAGPWYAQAESGTLLHQKGSSMKGFFASGKLVMAGLKEG